jgi:hypothetical protein
MRDGIQVLKRSEKSGVAISVLVSCRLGYKRSCVTLLTPSRSDLVIP